MTRPRDPRPRPEPMSAEDAAEIEAKYQQLIEFVQRIKDHSDAERLRERRQAESD